VGSPIHGSGMDEIFGPLSEGFMAEFSYSYPDENLNIKKAVYDF